MQNAERLTGKQLNEFLKGSEGLEFHGQDRAELYGWVQRVLVGQEYAVQDKKQRGAIRAYLSKVAGRSLAQSAPQPAVPEAGGQLGADAARCDRDWRAAQPRSARAAWFSAHRHGASRRLAWGQRGVSHQRRGFRNAMAGSGLREQNQRAIYAAGVGGDAA